MLKTKDIIKTQAYGLPTIGIQHVDNCINTILHDWIEIKTGVRSATIPQNWKNMMDALDELSIVFEIMLKESK